MEIFECALLSPFSGDAEIQYLLICMNYFRFVKWEIVHTKDAPTTWFADISLGIAQLRIFRPEHIDLSLSLLS